MTQIVTSAAPLDGTKPMSCAVGRYGELIVTQGGGVTPRRWSGSGLATPAGIAAPTVAPSCSLLTPVRYYMARCDITKPGAVYNSPPAVTIGSSTGQPTGFRQAKALSYLNQSSVGEVRITDGGKHYSAAPTVTLSATHGSGAAITASMDGTPPLQTSITQAEVTQGPPWDDELNLPVEERTQWAAFAPVEIPISAGGGTINTSAWVYSEDCDEPGGPVREGWEFVSLSITYTVQPPPAPAVLGTGCKIRIGFYGMGSRTRTTTPCRVDYWGAWGVSGVEVLAGGTGYTAESSFTITIAAAGSPPPTAAPAGKSLIIECRTPGNTRNTATPTFAVRALTITSGGTGYVVAPEIRFKSNSGFGASASCAVTNGVITSVELESGGGGYKTPPVVEVLSGGAEVFAVARPHLRGTYQCYYRYVDDTPEGSGGPIPSNLSPVREVDASAGAYGITWSVAGSGVLAGRNLSIELWRTTGNQATTLYRVKTISDVVTVGGTIASSDDLTDAELRDPDRAGYEAMPIVLPNGELNANRFTPPPDDKAVVVRYQDRFWYGVDTSGTEPNTIYFSEVDEPESVPEENEFVLQQSTKDGDAITALAPFCGTMLIFQSRHVYQLAFAQKPLLDASVTLMSYRGCLNQRCWDIHSGMCYVMDQHGVYAVRCGGAVDDISAPISNLFTDNVDFSDTKLFFLAIEPRSGTLRAFVSFKGDQAIGPATRVLCYDIASKTWWMERYPQPISSAAAGQLSNGEYRLLYSGRSGMMALDSGAVDIGRGALVAVTLTNKGAGYRVPPTVTVSGSGCGVELQACLNSHGQVAAIWILNPGYGNSASGNLSISAPDDPQCDAPVQATATFTATAAGSDDFLHTPYRVKTGATAFPTDLNSREGGIVAPRDVTLTYLPQPDTCDVALRLYYNNSPHPRQNVAARDRGAGFKQSTVDCAARLDMGYLTQETGYDSGVAKGVFANRTIEDMRASDRHVAVELIGARRTAEPVVFYELDVYGTSGSQQG